MAKLHCPICGKDYTSEHIEFTLTVNPADPTKWIKACPWCFEKSLGEDQKTEDDNIRDVFNSFTH